MKKKSNIGPLSDELQIKKLTKDNLAYLVAFIEEYFDTFVLMGYDLMGNKISIGNSKTKKDADAIITLTQDFLAKVSQPDEMDN